MHREGQKGASLETQSLTTLRGLTLKEPFFFEKYYGAPLPLLKQKFCESCLDTIIIEKMCVVIMNSVG